MTHGKATWLVLSLMLYIAGAGAATLEEIQRLNTAQQPGTVWICHGDSEVQVGSQHLTFADSARATVLSVQGASIRYRIERTSLVNGTVKARYTYEMSSRLAQDASEEKIDPDTIHISIPEDAAENARLARLFRANANSRQRFEDVRITAFPAFDIMPDPNDPTGMRYQCGPEERAG